MPIQPLYHVILYSLRSTPSAAHRVRLANTFLDKTWVSIIFPDLNHLSDISILGVRITLILLGVGWGAGQGWELWQKWLLLMKKNAATISYDHATPTSFIVQLEGL